MAGIMGGDSSGRAYRAVHGHMTARYWYRHATWNVACSLSGKVTVTASPCTGLAHHAHGRTGFSRLLRGRLAFVMLLPFMRSALAETSTRPPLKSPGQPYEGTGPAAGALYRRQAREAPPLTWGWGMLPTRHPSLLTGADGCESPAVSPPL